MDPVDRTILSHLQDDGRLSNVELAERVRLSPSATLRRVRNLETGGAIAGYHAVIDPKAVDRNYQVTVHTTLMLRNRETIEAFEAALLLGIMYGYLDRTGARREFSWVTLGGALGLAVSLVMGVAVGYLSGPLLDLGPDLVAAGVMRLAVALLTWHAWWMQKNARAMRGEVEQRLRQARATRQLWLVGLDRRQLLGRNLRLVKPQLVGLDHKGILTRCPTPALTAPARSGSTIPRSPR